jgi:hypothetical protein
MPSDPFKDELETRIARHRARLERLQAQYTELTSEIEITTGRLESAQRLYEAEFGEIYEGDAPARQEPLFEPPPGPLTGASWGDAIISTLQEVGRPLHVKELWAEMLARGFRSDSRDPQRSLVAMSIRHPGIVRVAPNTYALGPEPLPLPEGAQEEVGAM